MKRIKWAAVCLLCALAPAAAKEYSFQQAYERALATNDNLAAARQEVAMYQAQQQSAQGLYWPSIGVKGSFTRIHDPIAIDLNGIRSAIQPLYPAGMTLPSFELQVQEEHFWKAQAYATLSLYTGGQISAANQAARARVGAARAKEETLLQQLLVEVTSKYFGALLAREVVSVRKQFVDNARQNATDGAKMFRAGTVAKVEQMAVDVQQAQAERDYHTAVNDAALAQTLLKSLLTETETIDTPSTLFVLPAWVVPELETFKQQALVHNPTFALLDNQTDLSRAQTRAEQAGFLPSVYLFGSRELHTHDLTLLEPDWAYGIGLAWNLFEGGQTYHQTQAAQKQTQSLLELKEQHTKDILTGLEYYYKKMENARETYQALQEEIAFTQELYRTRQLGFKAGTSTSLEVNTALSHWMKAQLDSLKAQYDFVTSLAMLLQLSGQTEQFTQYARRAGEEL